MTNEEEASLEPDSLEPPLRFLTSSQPSEWGGDDDRADVVPQPAVATDVIQSLTEDKSWAPQFPSTVTAQEPT